MYGIIFIFQPELCVYIYDHVHITKNFQMCIKMYIKFFCVTQKNFNVFSTIFGHTQKKFVYKS